MSTAQVNRVSALVEFRAALVSFQHHAKAAMDSASTEITRVNSWLEDQRAEWKNEMRKAEEKLLNAKGELARRKWTAAGSDSVVDTTEQEKQVRKAQAYLDFCEEKYQKTAEWQRRFPDASQEYDGRARPFKDALDYDVNKMTAFMERLLQTLEKYLDTSPPSGS